MTHIGHLIKEELRRQRRPAAWLAKQLCYERGNIYKIFEKPSLDTTLLLRISIILRYNFFEIISRLEEKHILFEEEETEV
ncbi:MAG: XRE family transcriptional regulator [Prevotellaceae bacterium]|jgi:hypothetical protein|nr:XRE family transcriptional regulator [Prevotellaceae bacterium]